MIVKFHSRGAGSGSGPVDYLLGKDRQRDQASVLRGDPERVCELIDSCDFARSYTSGVLPFQEPDIADSEKSRLILHSTFSSHFVLQLYWLPFFLPHYHFYIYYE